MVGRIKSSLPKEEMTSEDLIAATLENAEPVVKSVTIGKKKAKYLDLFEVRDARTALIEMADDLIGELFLEAEKKS